MAARGELFFRPTPSFDFPPVLELPRGVELVRDGPFTEAIRRPEDLVADLSFPRVLAPCRKEPLAALHLYLGRSRAGASRLEITEEELDRFGEILARAERHLVPHLPLGSALHQEPDSL